MDRKGFAIWIGTPSGKNSFYDLYQKAKTEDDWYAALLTVNDTDTIPPEELNLAKMDMSEEEFEQEFLCSFEAAVRGSYYGKLLKDATDQQRVSKVPYEPNLQVHTSWDLGIGDSTAILFFQLYGNEVRIIDAEEHSGEGMAFYATLLEEKGYNYGTHYLPHDANVRELGTGKSRLEVLTNLGVTNIRVVPQQSVEDGIEAVRTIFPRLWIDERCLEFLNAISLYRREWDEKRQAYKGRPLHDFTSHYSDALRYMALSVPRDKPRISELQRRMSRKKQAVGWRSSVGMGV